MLRSQVTIHQVKPYNPDLLLLVSLVKTFQLQGGLLLLASQVNTLQLLEGLLLLVSSKCTSASGKPLKPSNVDISGKVASNTSKSRAFPPVAKGVSRRMPMTDASKRKTRLQRAFTSTMTAKSELASGAIEQDVMEEEGDLPNIDKADNENQLAVVEYVQDIDHFYWYTELEELPFYLLELCLVEYEALKWKPSMLAASAIYMAHHILQRMPTWTRLLQKHAHYRESKLKECVNRIAGFHKNAKEGDLKAVYNKY